MLLRRARYLSGLLHAARAVSGRIAGSTSGNVLLRRAQYRTADELSASCRIARSMIFGKVYNARWSIERTRRDHGLRLDSASLTASASHLKELLPKSPRPPLSSICAAWRAPEQPSILVSSTS